jgi:CheY-like chemotaxis protein
MTDLELAEAVAKRTAERVRDSWLEDIENLSASLRKQWQADLGALRDDLTAKGLLSSIQKEPVTSSLKAKVLVVDDNPTVLDAIVRVLNSAGLSTFSASGGPEAAAILDVEGDFDVVISDMTMPKNGHTLLMYVKENHLNIEIIMTSGYSISEKDVRNIGAFGFLPKPFSVPQAILMVERAIEMKRLKQLLKVREIISP